MFLLEILHIFFLILLYIFSLTICVKQSMSLNLFLVSLTLLLLTVLFYRLIHNKNRYAIMENRKIKIFLFSILAFVILYCLYIEKYYIVLFPVFFYIFSSMGNYFRSFLPENIKVILVNIKKDDQTLEDHFKNDFLVFDYVRTFRTIFVPFITGGGMVSLYTEVYYDVVLISCETFRFFAAYYLLLTFLCLCISLYSIVFLNAKTAYVAYSASKVAAIYTVGTGTVVVVASTTILPVAPPLEIYPRRFLDVAQDAWGAPRTASSIVDIRAQWQRITAQLLDPTLTNESMTTNRYIDHTKTTAALNKCLAGVLWSEVPGPVTIVTAPVKAVANVGVHVAKKFVVNPLTGLIWGKTGKVERPEDNNPQDKDS